VADEAELRLRLSMLDLDDRASHNVAALRCALGETERARHHAWLALNLVRSGQLDAAARALRAAPTSDDPLALVAATLARAALDAPGLVSVERGRARPAVPRRGAPADELGCATLVARARAQLRGARGRRAEAADVARGGLASAQRSNRRWAATGWLT